MSEHEPGTNEKVPAPKQPKRKPTVHEAEAMAKAAAYCKTRTQPLAYDIGSVEGKTLTLSVPHDEPAGFEALMGATFGTVSTEFAATMSADLYDTVRPRGEAALSSERMNAGIAAVAGIEPQNEAEAMLAVQMAGTHSVAMDMLARAKHATNTDHLERYGTLATKLLRTYTAQLEALAKVRRGGAQKVVVEHVHVHAGGQAIVGHVTGPQGGGRVPNGNQAHELTGSAALAFQADPSMLCADAGRDALPVASGEGEKAMPQTRRRQGKRSAEG